MYQKEKKRYIAKSYNLGSKALKKSFRNEIAINKFVKNHCYLS